MKTTQPFMRRIQSLEGESVILGGEYEERFARVPPVGAVVGLCLALASTGLCRKRTQRLERAVGAARHQQRQRGGSNGERRSPGCEQANGTADRRGRSRPRHLNDGRPV